MSGLPPFVSRDVTLTIYDGASPTPKSASFGNGSGLFDIPGLDAGNFEVVEVKNRQEHLALLKGESKTYEFSTEITVADVADLTNASSHRILDAILLRLLFDRIHCRVLIQNILPAVFPRVLRNVLALEILPVARLVGRAVLRLEAVRVRKNGVAPPCGKDHGNHA